MNYDFFLIDFRITINGTKLSGFAVWNSVQLNEFNYLNKLFKQFGINSITFQNDGEDFEVSTELFFKAYIIQRMDVDEAGTMVKFFPIVQGYHYGFMLEKSTLENILLGAKTEVEAPL